MKMLIAIYSQEADEYIVAAFKESGMHGYTKMEEVYGEGQETEPKLGTHIWPGKNNLLFLAIEDARVAQVKELLRQLKTKHSRAGIKAFLLPLEEAI